MVKLFSNGLSLAVLVVSATKQSDAFVTKPSGSSRQLANVREAQTLFALPKIVKKGEKVETEPDIGGVVQGLSFLGAGVVALGAALAGPQNGDVPPLNLPAISVPSKSTNTDTTRSSAPSITKKTEKKIAKAKKMRSSSGYDLDLDESRAAPMETKTSFDRTAAAKEAEEARQAAKAKSRAAAAEKQTALEARKQEAEARRNKLAEEKAGKEAARAKLQGDRSAKLVEAKEKATKEREAAAAARRAEVAANKEAAAAAAKIAKVEAKVVKAEEAKTKVASPEVVKQEEKKTPKEEEKPAKVTDSVAVKEKVVEVVEPKSIEVAKAPAPMPAPTPKPAPSPAPKPSPTSSGAALGKVSGSASGGQILRKEEVSADVINILKKYK